MEIILSLRHFCFHFLENDDGLQTTVFLRNSQKVQEQRSVREMQGVTNLEKKCPGGNSYSRGASFSSLFGNRRAWARDTFFLSIWAEP